MSHQANTFTVSHPHPNLQPNRKVRFTDDPVFGKNSNTVKNLLYDLGHIRLQQENDQTSHQPSPITRRSLSEDYDSREESQRPQKKKPLKSILKRSSSKTSLDSYCSSTGEESLVQSQSSDAASISSEECSSSKSPLEPRVVQNLLWNLGTLKLDDDKGDFDLDETSRDRLIGEKCGLFGCIANGDWPTNLDVAHIICLGLVGLQHRGQEAAGIVTCKNAREPLSAHRGMGLVSQIFNDPVMLTLKGNLGVGHTRYSTMGGSENVQLAQPFVVHTSYGTIAVGHNGELVNSQNLRRRILDQGVGLSTGSDSELITQCLSMPPPPQLRLHKGRKRINTNELKKMKEAQERARLARKRRSMENINRRNSTESDSEISAVSDTLSKSTISHKGKENVNERANGESDRKSNSSINGAGADGNTADGEDNEGDLEDMEDEQDRRHWTSLISSSPDVGNFIAELEAELQDKDEEIVSRLLHLMTLTPLSYSLVVMFNECIHAVRDPYGNRPLCVGQLVPPAGATDNPHEGAIEGWVISSESCSFPSVCARVWRDVFPGEIIKLQRNEMPKTLVVIRPEPAHLPAMCIFEYVYFARPDSIIEGQMVYAVRQKCGEQLALEAPILDHDPIRDGELIVSPVPESSIPAALGFAHATKLRYVEVFCKNRYVGRTFIQPSARLRRLGVAKKFGPLIENFQGKSIVLIDDSIVRGTTIGQLIRLLKDAGAKQVHIRIASPPLHHPCYMGINIPTAEELIANHLSPNELAATLGAASLIHLSVEGLKKSVQSGILDAQRQWPRSTANDQVREATHHAVGHCTACLTGEYPVELEF